MRTAGELRNSPVKYLRKDSNKDKNKKHNMDLEAASVGIAKRVARSC